jgi:hypothetical protein
MFIATLVRHVYDALGYYLMLVCFSPLENETLTTAHA